MENNKVLNNCILVDVRINGGLLECLFSNWYKHEGKFQKVFNNQVIIDKNNLPGLRSALGLPLTSENVTRSCNILLRQITMWKKKEYPWVYLQVSNDGTVIRQIVKHTKNGRYEYDPSRMRWRSMAIEIPVILDFLNQDLLDRIEAATDMGTSEYKIEIPPTGIENELLGHLFSYIELTVETNGYIYFENKFDLQRVLSIIMPNRSQSNMFDESNIKVLSDSTSSTAIHINISKEKSTSAEEDEDDVLNFSEPEGDYMEDDCPTVDLDKAVSG